MEQQIISAVRAMREAHKEYFRTRDVNVLRRSKALEKRVDTLLAEYDNPQKTYSTMAQIINSDKNFKVIEVYLSDCIKWGGLGICDHCNTAIRKG